VPAKWIYPRGCGLVPAWNGDPCAGLHPQRYIVRLTAYNDDNARLHDGDCTRSSSDLENMTAWGTTCKLYTIT